MSSSIPPSTPGRPWQPPTPEDLQPELPQYEISGLLGRGGMGAVYRARQKSLKREVAIKVLPPMTDDGGMQFAERFKTEAESMARLNHPGIVAVYDAGETPGGLLYIVMELVEGTDVAQMIHEAGLLPPDHAYAITAHVCDALTYAHENGLIHRDIKPANIMVDTQGRVKVADFGLAKMADENSGFTQSHLTVGTPDFVAPEALISDEPLDARADLYAVGVMLYQMLTGRIPRGAFKPASTLVPGIDVRFDEIVLKAMQVDREDRHSSAAELRQHLDTLLIPAVSEPELQRYSSAVIKKAPSGARQVKSSPVAPPASKKPLFVGLGVVALLVVGFIVMATRKSSTEGSMGILPGGPPPVTSTEKSGESEESLIAPKPDVSPAAAPPVPPSQAAEEKSSIGSPRGGPPPIASTEQKTEPPAKPMAPKPDPVPAKTPPLPEKAPEPVAVAAPPTAAPPSTAPPTAAPPSTAPPTASTALPPELAELDAQFLKLQAERVMTPFETDLAKLNTGYLGGIGKKIAQEKAAGNLDGILALEAEQKRLTAKEPVPETDEAETPESLKALRVIYREALGNLAATRATNLSALVDPLDKRLAQMETDFTKSDRLADAKAVRGYREVLGQGSAGTPARTGTTGADKSVRAPVTPATTLALKDGVVNSLGMKFLPVKGTDVLFCIHEVRYKDYAVYAAEVPGVDAAWKDQNADGFTPTDRPEDHPVMKVNWDDAQAFCAWLSKKEGKTYRLPTDQEWSVAVGIGRDEKWKSDTTPLTVFKDQTAFPWGDDWPPPKGAGNYSDQSRKTKAPNEAAQYLDGYDDTFPTTAPVMSFEANKFGLYDMGGNVYEWVGDWYSVEQKDRVLRGGSWGSDGRGALLSSHRFRFTPGSRYYSNGFRVVVVGSASGR